MRILITGGTGFVGSHAVRALAGSHELFATTRGQAPAELEGLAEWIEVDLAARIDPSKLPVRLDAVVHLAQSSRYADLPAGAEDVIAVNLEATRQLLAHALRAGAERFLLASTGGVYARSPEPLAEDAPLAPQNAYFASKLDAERALLDSGLQRVILRPFFVYGAGQRRMLIAGLIRRVLEAEPIVIAGEPGLRSNPVHVADAVAAIEAGLRTDADGAFNVGGPEVASISQLVATIGELAAREPRLSNVEADGGGDLIADVSRLRGELGVSPRIGLRDGLREAIRDWRSGGDDLGSSV